MNQELRDMAKAAGFERLGHTDNDWVCYPEDIEAFAKLVAKHTLSNIDPSKFMSYQEGIEAGRFAEREACAKIVEPTEEHRRDASWGYVGGEEGVELLDGLVKQIRARGEKK